MPKWDAPFSPAISADESGKFSNNFIDEIRVLKKEYFDEKLDVFHKFCRGDRDNGSTTVAQSQTVNYDPSAPRIVSTEIDRNEEAHQISLYTGARPLSYVRLTPPEDVRITEGVQVMTESGRQVEAALFRGFREDNQYILAFAQPVPPRTTIQITLQEVEPTVPNAGAFFNYELAGKHVGLDRLVPYGIARFQAKNSR